MLFSALSEAFGHWVMAETLRRTVGEVLLRRDFLKGRSADALTHYVLLVSI